MNIVIIVGRLGKDPEVRYSQNGNAISNLSVATDESYKDQSGKWVKKSEWHRVVVFGKAAENCANSLQKGDLVYVNGSLGTREWTNQQGQKQYITEIKAKELIPIKERDNSRSQQQNNQASENQAQNLDDVPF